jgi:hypothetical protein
MEVGIRLGIRFGYPGITSGIKSDYLDLLHLVRIKGETDPLRILQLPARFKLKRKTRPETAGLNLEKL